MPSQAASIAVRLRIETRREHEMIEANPRLARLTSHDLDIEAYADILTRLAGFHEPVEQGLRAWAPAFPASLGLDERLVKTALLRRDLADIGAAVPSAEAERAAFGDFHAAEGAWGCLYVVEGATLGGQVIGRHLAEVLGLTAERGAAFHRPYGALTGARWQGLRSALGEAVERGGLDPDAVVAGARAAFAALDRWMA